MKSIAFLLVIFSWVLGLRPMVSCQELTLCPPNTTWFTTTFYCMFDIENKSTLPLTIKHLAFSGNGTLEIFRTTSASSFMGVESSPNAWTQLGSTFDRSIVIGTICAFSSFCIPPQNIRIGPGEKIGLYVRGTSAPFFGELVTRFSANPHGIWREDNHVALHTGIISTAQFGVGTGGVWEIPMGVIYTLGDADLSATYSMQAPEGLTVSVNNFAPSATLGYTLVSTDTSLPLGGGPVLGLLPDASTFGLLTTPYWPGNPLHFHPSDAGLFPNTPWFASQQELVGLSGLSLDLVSIFLDAQGILVDQSQVQRVAIP